MSNRSLWKDYLSAAVKTGGKLVPGVAQVIDLIETVEDRRESAARHEQALDELSRVERSVVEVIEREMKAVLAKLRLPNITPRELEEEIANLYAMRVYGREPFLAQGLIANSQWYDQLRAKPNLYGRVLEDRDTTRPECFYMFIDADRTRLLEVSPFVLQQLLSGQSRGAPEAKIIGTHDLFVERLSKMSNARSILNDDHPPRALFPVQAHILDGWVPRPYLAQWHRRAVAGDVRAMTQLGDSLLWGNVSEQAMAIHWYKKAADVGNAEAMAGLSSAYSLGRGVPQDEIESARWTGAAADAGHAESMFAIALIYYDGDGVQTDFIAAAGWYRKAAAAGHAHSMYMLASMCENGRGVATDEAEAVRWYHKSAEAGEDQAMLVLSERYAEGRGVKQSHAEAIRWKRKHEDATTLG